MSAPEGWSAPERVREGGLLQLRCPVTQMALTKTTPSADITPHSVTLAAVS